MFVFVCGQNSLLVKILALGSIDPVYPGFKSQLSRDIVFFIEKTLKAELPLLQYIIGA